MSADAQCTTCSGPFRCSKRLHHEGECECEAPSTTWVGPARSGADITRAIDAAHGRAKERVGDGDA